MTSTPDADLPGDRRRRPLNFLGVASCIAATVAGLIGFTFAHATGKGEGNGVMLTTAILLLLAILLMMNGVLLFRRERISLVFSLHLIAFGALGLNAMLQYARASSNRVPCASNLRQIGLAMILYAQAHQDRLPSSIEELALSGDLVPENLVCPESKDTIATGKSEPLAIELARPGHNSYAYLGAGHHLADFGSGDILAYERQPNEGNGGNILGGDGHVEWLIGSANLAARVAEMKQRLAASTQPTTRRQP
ncbi:MAG TPA: hypothetical protein VH370_15930 [Humisphaera sp.]|nr:hypothetical protein [Humisphaera sp.]